MYAKDRTLLSSLAFADPDKKNPRHDLACQYVAQPKVAEKLVKTFVPLTSMPLGKYSSGKQVYPQYPGYSIERMTWRFSRSGYSESVRAEAAALEVPISKGLGQYRTTIGFVDAHIPFVISRLTRGDSLLEWKLFRDPPVNGYPPHCEALLEPQLTDAAGPTPYEEVSEYLGDLFIEVKIGKESLGSILRQINLYKEYRPFICARVHGAHVHRSEKVSLNGGGCETRGLWVLVTDFPLSEAEVASLACESIRHVTLGEDFETFVKNSASSSVSKSLSI
jgi:hypothetical protein